MVVAEDHLAAAAAVPGRRAQHVQRVRRPALLHEDRRQPGVARAPAASSAVQHARPQPRVEVVDVGLEHDGVRRRTASGAAAGRRAPGAGRSPARQGRARRHRCRCAAARIGGSGPYAVTVAASSAAPVGVVISCATGPARTGAPVQQGEHGGRRDGQRPVRAAGRARARGRPGSPSARQRRARAARPRRRRRRRPRRARRPRGSGRRRASCGARPPRRAARRAKTSSAVARTARRPARRARRSARTSDQVRVRGCSSTCTSTLHGADAGARDGRALRRTGSTPTRSTAACRTASSTPASTSAPSSMSPRDARRAVEPADHRAHAPCADPRREDACAEAVVDVDDAHAGRAGVEHREQRGEPAEARAVADAGRHRHHRRADQPADDRGQRALHAGDDDEAVGAVERPAAPR